MYKQREKRHQIEGHGGCETLICGASVAVRHGQSVIYHIDDGSDENAPRHYIDRTASAQVFRRVETPSQDHITTLGVDAKNRAASQVGFHPLRRQRCADSGMAGRLAFVLTEHLADHRKPI